MDHFTNDDYIQVSAPGRARLLGVLAAGCGGVLGLALVALAFFILLGPNPLRNKNVSDLPATLTPIIITRTSEPDFFFTPTLAAIATVEPSATPAPTDTLPPPTPTPDPSPTPRPQIQPTNAPIPTVTPNIPTSPPPIISITVTPLPPASESPGVSGSPTPVGPFGGATPIPSLPLDDAPRRVGNGPDAGAQYFPRGEFQLDGQLDEWTGDSVPLTSAHFGPDAWAGPQDLSGTAWLGWDENYLFFAAQVYDDVHVQTQTGWEMFRGDSVELWIDADLPGDFAEARGDADDFQLGLSPGDFASRPPEGVIYIPLRDLALNRQIAVSAQPTANGYTLEAVIPWALLRVAPQRRLVLGYAIDLSDNDAPGRAQQQTQVTEDPNFQFNRPPTFGNLILE